MDTGEYETNALIINNIASIAYRFYEPSHELASTFPVSALEIESALRSEGCLVFFDATRQGIWHFRCLDKAGPEAAEQFQYFPDVARYGLVLIDQGIVEPPALLRARGQVQESIHGGVGASAAAAAPDQFSRQTMAANLQGTVQALRDQERRDMNVSAAESEAMAAAQKVLYENFVVSCLLTISAEFCRLSGAIPLNYRTVLFLPDVTRGFGPRDAAAERYPIIGTFKTALTAIGSLILSMALTRCKGLLPLDDASAPGITLPGQGVVAAPFGTMTRNQPGPPVDGTASLAQTPSTQGVSLRSGADAQDPLWKQTCLRYLQHRGIPPSKLQNSHWVYLLMSRPRPSQMRDYQASPGFSSVVTLPWPGSLCFRKRAIDVPSTSRVLDTVLSGHEESHDPLFSAKTWLNSTSEREVSISRRNAERVASATKEANTADSKLVSFGDISTTGVRRPSGPTAAVLYPTPPGGVQQGNGFNSLVDGTLSSPGNPLSIPTTSDPDNITITTTTSTMNTVEGFDLLEPKRQQNGGNGLNDATNMFADMGGDMFDENDITEADFNFFDQQPNEMDLDPTISDLVSAESVAPTPKVDDASRSFIKRPNSRSQPVNQPVVFAKPELKHARSSQSELSIQRGRVVRQTPTKRESSPFDAAGVFKRVRASLPAAIFDESHATFSNRRGLRVFDRVEFDSKLPLINKKYEPGGPYDWVEISKSSRPRKPGSWMLPETEYLKRHGKSARKLRDKTPVPLNMIMRSLTGLEPPTMSSPSKLDGSLSERDDSSAKSDQDDSSYTTEEPNSPQKVAAKYPIVDDDALSQVPSMRELEFVEEIDPHLALELLRLSKPDVPELPFPALFSDPEPLVPDMSLMDEDLIHVAQILTEQAATGSLNICNVQDDERMAMAMSQTRQGLPPNVRGSIRMLEDVASQFLGTAIPLRLKGLLDVQDVAVPPRPVRMMPRQMTGRENSGDAARPSNLYQMPSPNLEVRRADTKLSVLPSAVTFWDSLGLAPSSGTKSISAVCVFPGWSGMRDNVETFLDRVKSVYEFLKLGNFDVMTLGPDLDDGLVPYEVDRISTSPDATVTGHGSALIESMEALRGPFLSTLLTETNFVVYFLYSPSNPATIVEACTAFQRFWEAYQKLLAVKQRQEQNELVMQLVSVDILSSSASLVVTPAPELVKLCMETYDRCTLFGGPMPAPAIRIEQLLPRIIDFKLTNTPSASLMHENSCIHIAYAQSVDERWVTAAWTDDRGNLQTTASYCLGRRGKPISRTMNEVANEIWETTLGLISVWRVHWRIIITKCGPMNQQEMDFWVDLARTEINATVTMILMTVDTNPSLQLLPPIMRLPGSATMVSSAPVSTPQTSAVSPEQMSMSASTTPTNASTTPTETAAAAAAADPNADADAVLADVSDQTWGAIANHRLSNSASLLELRPALISGYLIKRTGLAVEDAPVVLEVNLVHTDTGPRAYEPLLREMLSHFRGLGTLARARGVVDRETDVRPWHVAAAEKAVRALYLLM